MTRAKRQGRSGDKVRRLRKIFVIEKLGAGSGVLKFEHYFGIDDGFRFNDRVRVTVERLRRARRDEMMYTLKIWYTAKHDDHTVVECFHQPDPVKQIADLVRLGGFWAGDVWIPLHRIGSIEKIEETEIRTRKENE